MISIGNHKKSWDCEEREELSLLVKETKQRALLGSDISPFASVYFACPSIEARKVCEHINFPVNRKFLLF